MHPRLFTTGLQGSAEGNPGTTHDFAQVFTPWRASLDLTGLGALHQEVMAV